MRPRMRSRVSVARQVSRHGRHLRHPPDLVPALGPRHFPSQKVHSRGKQSCRSVIRRRRQPQKWPRRWDPSRRSPATWIRIAACPARPLCKLPQSIPNTISAAPASPPCAVRCAAAAPAPPRSESCESAAVVLYQTHRNNLRARRRQQRREKHEHPKYCDPGPVGTSRDFHAVRIARTVPVRATPEDFSAKSDFAGSTEFSGRRHRKRIAGSPTMNRRSHNKSRIGARFRRAAT